MTKDELKAVLDSKNIEYKKSEKKDDLIQKLI